MTIVNQSRHQKTVARQRSKEVAQQERAARQHHREYLRDSRTICLLVPKLVATGIRIATKSYDAGGKGTASIDFPHWKLSCPLYAVQDFDYVMEEEDERAQRLLFVTFDSLITRQKQLHGGWEISFDTMDKLPGEPDLIVTGSTPINAITVTVR